MTTVDSLSSQPTMMYLNALQISRARHPRLFAGNAKRVALRAIATAVLLAATSFIGCSSAPPAFDVVADHYDGPPLHLEPTDAGSVLVMNAPTPGWQITLDAVRENFGKQDVFVTVRRPSALFSSPEIPVEQRVATTVPTSTALATFVRTLAFDGPRNDETPYSAGPATSGAAVSNREKQ